MRAKNYPKRIRSVPGYVAMVLVIGLILVGAMAWGSSQEAAASESSVVQATPTPEPEPEAVEIAGLRRGKARAAGT